VSAATAARRTSRRGAQSWLGDAVRAGAAPAACAAVLIGMLSAWVATGGAGSITPVRIQVTLAAVPMRGYTAAADSTANTATTYLTIRNLSSRPDELISVRSPVAHRIVLRRRTSLTGPGTVVPGLAIPGHGSLTLSPFGDDVILEDPAPFEADGSVPLTLTFARAGQVTVDAPVTAPGTP
jgi:periplasmic copper chaperone A